MFCKLCSSDFSCDRGITELKRHEKNKKHSNNNAKNNVEILRGNMTVSTQDSFKKAEDVNAKALKIEDAARVAEAKLSNLITTHSSQRGVKQCGGAVAVQVPKKSVAIEQEERDNRKKKKLAFLTTESLV